MGWFWADKSVQTNDAPLATDPPKGWMSDYIQLTLWAPKADIWAKPTSGNAPSGCPVNHEELMKKPSKCPVDHTKWTEMAKRGKNGSAAANGSADAASEVPVQAPTQAIENSGAQPSACPVDHSKFNKLNNMPSLHTNKLPGQQTNLPTDRTISSIPRGEKPDSGFWEYPSPQQMLNAMVRKSGPDGIEEDAVESMVDVHNFLNEGVWEEVLEWEKPHTEESSITPRLLRFQGRPGELTPKARMLQALGKLYPSKYGVPPPFDRHDWTVLRAVPGKKDEWQQVRYVIDFYEIPDAEDDVPTFTVDVRPALDSAGSAYDRARVAWGPTISKALGWE